MVAKLATASQQLEPEERLARERQAEAARLVDATVGAVYELAEEARLDQEVVHELLERVARRLDGPRRSVSGRRG